MRLSSKIIKFGMSSSFPILEKPQPAQVFIPDWYKKIPAFSGSGKPEVSAYSGNKTMKLCMPMLDSFTTGYIVELWQDIEVVKGLVEEDTRINWAIKPDVLRSRPPAAASTFPVPAGHNLTHFVWDNPYVIETPKGYSVLVTHPLNRHDLPFTTLSAVVDADKLAMGTGSIPFFLKSDFEGIIPKGTPLFQVIPFKRENWESVEDKEIAVKDVKVQLRSQSVTHGFYKKSGWHKKNYN